MSASQLQLIARAVALGCVAGLAGCDVLFGLNELSDVSEVPPSSRVHGTVWERYVTNGSDFTPLVVDHVYPDLEIAATLEDGTEVSVTYNEDGSFELYRAHAEQLYRLSFTIDGAPIEYQLTNAEVVLPRIVAGRPMRRPQGVSYFQFPYPTLVADLVAAYVATTGLYSMTYSGMYGPTVTFDWRTATPATGSRLGMLDANENDRAYVLEFRIDRTSFAPLAYQVIDAASSAVVTQATGRTHALPGPTAVARNGCARMIAQNATELERLDAVVDRVHAYRGGDWHAFGVPAPSQAALSGAVHLAVAGQAPAIDSEIVATFHDPFPGWSLVVQAGALLGFDTQLPGTTTPVRLYDFVRRYRLTERGPLDCSQPAVDMAATVAIPGSIQIAGISLDTDAQTVALPDGDIEVTWSAAAEGTVHYTSVVIHELIAADAFTTNVSRRGVTTTGTRVLFDRSLFVSGSTYIIAVTNAIGRPAAAVEGDWSLIGEEIELASVWSRYFTVQ